MSKPTPTKKGAGKATLLLIVVVILAVNFLVFYFLGGEMSLNFWNQPSTDAENNQSGPAVSSSQFPEEIDGFTLQSVSELPGQEGLTYSCMGSSREYPAEKKYKLVYRKEEHEVNVSIAMQEDTSGAEECLRTMASRNDLSHFGKQNLDGEELTYGYIKMAPRIMQVTIITNKGYTVRVSDIARNMKEEIVKYQVVERIAEELVRRADL